MSSPNSPYNVQYGFEVGDASVLTIGGTVVGFLDGEIRVGVQLQVNFLRADMYAAPIKASVVAKDVTVEFTMKEVLGANLVAAFGSGAYTGSSIVVSSANQGEVALVIVTKGPDGATATATMSKAVNAEGGTWTIPFASGQTISTKFHGVGDSANSGRAFAIVHS